MIRTARVPASAGTEQERDAQIASAIKALLANGDGAGARQRFAEIVDLHQRRASRIALHYLRDAADADEAVQDAFVKAYLHLETYREELPFHTWFTRILVNACLDRLKARGRRERWLVRLLDAAPEEHEAANRLTGSGPTPEQALLASERKEQLTRALDTLPARQRLVVVLSQFEGCSPREVAAATGLRESTVRVHLFRAIRNLRKVLAGS